MKSLFTVQSKDVLQILLEKEEYYPDIKKAIGYDDMKKLYPYFLEVFNKLNASSHTGFVFSFLRDNKTGNDLQTIDDVYNYFFTYPGIMTMFNFWDDQFVILEIEIDENINLTPIDINDSIKLDAVITEDHELLEMCGYESQDDCDLDISNIMKCFEVGTVNPHTKLKSFIQGHYPYIKLNDIKKIHPNYDYHESKDYNAIKLFDLPNEAKQLNNIINNDSSNNKKLLTNK